MFNTFNRNDSSLFTNKQEVEDNNVLDHLLNTRASDLNLFELVLILEDTLLRLKNNNIKTNELISNLRKMLAITSSEVNNSFDQNPLVKLVEGGKFLLLDNEDFKFKFGEFDLFTKEYLDSVASSEDEDKLEFAELLENQDILIEDIKSSMYQGKTKKSPDNQNVEEKNNVIAPANTTAPSIKKVEETKTNKKTESNKEDRVYSGIADLLMSGDEEEDDDCGMFIFTPLEDEDDKKPKKKLLEEDDLLESRFNLNPSKDKYLKILTDYVDNNIVVKKANLGSVKNLFKPTITENVHIVIPFDKIHDDSFCPKKERKKINNAKTKADLLETRNPLIDTIKKSNYSANKIESSREVKSTTFPSKKEIKAKKQTAVNFTFGIKSEQFEKTRSANIKKLKSKKSNILVDYFYNEVIKK